MVCLTAVVIWILSNECKKIKTMQLLCQTQRKNLGKALWFCTGTYDHRRDTNQQPQISIDLKPLGGQYAADSTHENTFCTQCVATEQSNKPLYVSIKISVTSLNKTSDRYTCRTFKQDSDCYICHKFKQGLWLLNLSHPQASSLTAICHITSDCYMSYHLWLLYVITPLLYVIPPLTAICRTTSDCYMSYHLWLFYVIPPLTVICHTTSDCYMSYQLWLLYVIPHLTAICQSFKQELWLLRPSNKTSDCCIYHIFQKEFWSLYFSYL